MHCLVVCALCCEFQGLCVTVATACGMFPCPSGPYYIRVLKKAHTSDPKPDPQSLEAFGGNILDLSLSAASTSSQQPEDGFSHSSDFIQ